MDLRNRDMTFKQKIEEVVARTLPKGASYTVSVSKSRIRDTIIVRVVTSAWKSLPHYIRVLKIQNALRQALSEREQQKILRVSVFTPEKLRQVLLGGGSSRSNAYSPSPSLKQIAAKLKARRGANSTKQMGNQALLRAALAKIHNG